MRNTNQPLKTQLKSGFKIERDLTAHKKKIHQLIDKTQNAKKKKKLSLNAICIFLSSWVITKLNNNLKNKIGNNHCSNFQSCGSETAT